MTRNTETVLPARNGHSLRRDRGQDVKIAQYLAESARWEIGRTGESANALLSAFGFVGTVSAAAFAVIARQGHPFAALVLALAAVPLLVAFLAIVWAIRPRLPKRGAGTGWPTLLATQGQGDAVTRHVGSLAEYPAAFYANDAQTLARIAFKKHRIIRFATTLVLVGVPVGVLGGLLYAVGF